MNCVPACYYGVLQESPSNTSVEPWSSHLTSSVSIVWRLNCIPECILDLISYGFKVHQKVTLPAGRFLGTTIIPMLGGVETGEAWAT